VSFAVPVRADAKAYNPRVAAGTNFPTLVWGFLAHLDLSDHAFGAEKSEIRTKIRARIRHITRVASLIDFVERLEILGLIGAQRNFHARIMTRKHNAVLCALNLHLKNYRQYQRTLRRLLVEVALQLDTDLFFDDTPVCFFLRCRLIHSPQHDFAGSPENFVAVFAG